MPHRGGKLARPAALIRKSDMAQRGPGRPFQRGPDGPGRRGPTGQAGRHNGSFGSKRPDRVLLCHLQLLFWGKAASFASQPVREAQCSLCLAVPVDFATEARKKAAEKWDGRGEKGWGEGGFLLNICFCIFY